MDASQRGELPARLEGVRRRFEQWRRMRKAPRIPDSLWTAAAQMASRYGISRTAVVLRVNAARLKDHLSSQSAAAGGSETKSAAGFVELTPFTRSGSCECLLELEDGSGAKMRVRLQSTGMPDLVALSRSFWNPQS